MFGVIAKQGLPALRGRLPSFVLNFVTERVGDTEPESEPGALAGVFGSDRRAGHAAGLMAA